MIRMDSSWDLRCDPAAHRVRRRPATARVHFAPEKGVIETDEGTVSHDAGAAVVTGGRNEQWPVERTRFEATYEAVAPTRMGEDGVYRHRPDVVLARRLDQPFKLTLFANRGTLSGAPGDWLVQYAPGDVGVVREAVFADTYEVVA
jgi:hypothetical protein